MKKSADQAIMNAVARCRKTGLQGWGLVEYAQNLVAYAMQYSYYNSFDQPDIAFAKGLGYCWQQAGALNIILKALGMDSRLVHATRNRFPDVVRDCVTVRIGVSGHVWCAVRIDGEEKYVCPGRPQNRPGVFHYQIISKVHDFKGPIVIFSYYGSAILNYYRGKKFMVQKAKQDTLYNPDKCPCKKTKCANNKICDACKENHHGKGSKTACERRLEK